MLQGLIYVLFKSFYKIVPGVPNITLFTLLFSCTTALCIFFLIIVKSLQLCGHRQIVEPCKYCLVHVIIFLSRMFSLFCFSQVWEFQVKFPTPNSLSAEVFKFPTQCLPRQKEVCQPYDLFFTHFSNKLQSEYRIVEEQLIARK